MPDVVDHLGDRPLLVAGDHHDRSVRARRNSPERRRIRISHRTDCATEPLSSCWGSSTSAIEVRRPFSLSASSIERITQPSTFKYSKAPKRPCGARSEERRVGKECRSRWSPNRYKKRSDDKGVGAARDGCLCGTAVVSFLTLRH